MIIVNINHTFRNQKSCCNQKDPALKPRKMPPSREQCLQGIRQGFNNENAIANMVKFTIQMTKGISKKSNLDIKNKKYVIINHNIFERKSKMQLRF